MSLSEEELSKLRTRDPRTLPYEGLMELRDPFTVKLDALLDILWLASARLEKTGGRLSSEAWAFLRREADPAAHRKARKSGKPSLIFLPELPDFLQKVEAHLLPAFAGRFEEGSMLRRELEAAEEGLPVLRAMHAAVTPLHEALERHLLSMVSSGLDGMNSRLRFFAPALRARNVVFNGGWESSVGGYLETMDALMESSYVEECLYSVPLYPGTSGDQVLAAAERARGRAEHARARVETLLLLSATE